MTGIVLLSLRLLLFIALYALLAAILLGLLYSLRKESLRLSRRKTPGLTLLAATETPETLETFYRSQVTIGRNPACDCVIDQETISAVHARFSYRKGHWWLEDLESTNGTFINEERIAVPVVLDQNDQLRFGELEYSVRWETD